MTSTATTAHASPNLEPCLWLWLIFIPGVFHPNSEMYILLIETVASVARLVKTLTAANAGPFTSAHAEPSGL